MGYKYELHLHNSIGSKCSSFTAEEIVTTFLEQGYTGVAVTDHFFNGNTAAPGKEYDWKFRVEKYCDSYRSVKKEGEKRGLDVLFGFEYSVPYVTPINHPGGCDFLVFGLDESWLVQHGGDVATADTNAYLNRAREAGGLVIQAHPFRLARSYMKQITIFPDCVDGVEVLNGNPNTMGIPNELARHYAEGFGKIMTAGSDIHDNHCQNLCVTELPEKVKDECHLIEILRTGKQKLYVTPNKMYVPRA